MALIRLAQADPAIAVLVRTESAETPEAKKAWSVVWDRLSPVTTVIGAMVLAVALTPATARANPINISNLHVPSAHSLYIMSEAHPELARTPHPPTALHKPTSVGCNSCRH
ncbi:DUF3693 domain-containing protein [Xanthomonas vesicatoria]|uniref:DUF3693 domain-containing protein n=1 Tax=Xanthomonas vesicatoria TaxID=56460 RepID=UPI001F48E883|nr:DUF3693 domain-containing protein [Xanthomonas vesicatoria]